MAAVAVFVAFPGHGLAAQRPAETAVRVAALGEVGDGAAFYFHQGDVLVVPTAIGPPVAKEVTAVRAPGKLLVAVAVGVIDVFVEALGLAAFGGKDHQFRAVTQIGQPLAVRGYLHLKGSFPFRAHALFLELHGVGEQFVFLLGEAALVDAPAAAALGCVIELTAVLGEAHAPLLLRRVGDAAGGVEFHGGDKNIAPHYQSHFFSVRRNGQGRCALEGEGIDVFLIFVTREGDVHFAALESVQVAIIGIGHRAVLGHGQEADRVFVVEGELNLVFRVRDAAAEDVGRFAVLLAQEVEGVPIGPENGVAVLAFKRGKHVE